MALDQIQTPSTAHVGHLSSGTTLLRGQYRINRYLASGGFGITYLATDSLDRQVVIKECFPQAFCCRTDQSVRIKSRSYLDDYRSIVSLFVREAKALSKLSHRNIVGVHQVFEDNDTAYMALDFVRGTDMLSLIKSGQQINPTTVRQLLMQLLKAIEYVHDNDVLHRDISPDNVLLDASGAPVLIDFGAAREEATKVSRMLSDINVVKD